MRLLKKAGLVALFTSLLAAVSVASAVAQDTSAGGEAAAAGVSIIFFVCWGLALIVGIGFLVFWILMLVDCIKREEKDFPGSTGNSKTIWLVVLLASWLVSAYWLAAIIYYFMVKRKAASMPSAPTPPPSEPTQQA